MKRMESQTDQLVQRACRQDQAAANELIELSYERIYAFLRRLAANDADAADLTQRTFSRVWQSLPTFAGRSSFSSWIHGIAHHVYADWRRANHRSESRSEGWWAERVCGAALPDETSRAPIWQPDFMLVWMHLTPMCGRPFTCITTKDSRSRRRPMPSASPPAR